MSVNTEQHIFLESVQDAVKTSLLDKKPLLVLASGKVAPFCSYLFYSLIGVLT